MKNSCGSYIVFVILALSRIIASTFSDPIMPNKGKEWMTLKNSRVEFQPAADIHDSINTDPKIRSAINNAQDRFLFGGSDAESYEDLFVDGSQTYYDDYQQAWRYIGTYIDCGFDGDDGDDEDGGECPRFLLWAAYIDEQYQGGGVNEYQYYNKEHESWDRSACAGGSRCAKMDCHLSSTHWKLLGFFKNKADDDFFEQLFKHEGYCLWSNDEYNLMSNLRESWPDGCTKTYTQVDDSYLYYDIKPVANGGMTLGLYTDAKCSKDYTGHYSIADVMSNQNNRRLLQGKSRKLDDYNYNLVDYLDDWNDALGVYKVCQPCIAYNLNGNNKNDRRRRRRRNEEGGDFDCDDDAGYTNVNQCMKFSDKTDMYTATFHDVRLAIRQGTVLETHVVGNQGGSGIGFGESTDYKGTSASIAFWILSTSIFVVGIIFLWRACKKKSNSSRRMRQPLVS